MTLEIRKALIVLVTALFASVAGTAVAGTATPKAGGAGAEQKVDCKKTPDHPECKKR